MKIKIINKSGNPLPSYETIGSAGLDLRANLPELISLKPLERKLIPTGLFIELPNGYEAQIRPRSGLAIKFGITLPNSPATIDSDYRGELRIPIINLSTESFTINHGDRIAQMIISKYERIELQEAVELEETERGARGFGHTGIS